MTLPSIAAVSCATTFLATHRTAQLRAAQAEKEVARSAALRAAKLQAAAAAARLAARIAAAREAAREAAVQSRAAVETDAWRSYAEWSQRRLWVTRQEMKQGLQSRAVEPMALPLLAHARRRRGGEVAVARLWRHLGRSLRRRPCGVYRAVFAVLDREQRSWIGMRDAAKFLSFLLPFASPAARTAVLRLAFTDAVRQRRHAVDVQQRPAQSYVPQGRPVDAHEAPYKPPSRPPRRLDEEAFVSLCQSLAFPVVTLPLLEHIVGRYTRAVEDAARLDARTRERHASEASKAAAGYLAARSEALIAATRVARARRLALGEAQVFEEERRWRAESEELLRVKARVEAVRQAAQHAEAEKRAKALEGVAMAVRAKVRESRALYDKIL